MNPSKRELQREVEELVDDSTGGDLGRPLTDTEKTSAGDEVDVEAWDETPTTRQIFRLLTQAAQEAHA